MILRPFLSFYGGKYRASKFYPSPRYDTIIESFAGSGTTGAAAIALGRRFILVDSNPTALAVMAHRFNGVDGIEWIGFDPTPHQK